MSDFINAKMRKPQTIHRLAYTTPNLDDVVYYRSDPVFVFSKQSGPYIAVYSIYEDGDEIWYDYHSDKVINDTIDYWMPLPLPTWMNTWEKM